MRLTVYITRHNRTVLIGHDCNLQHQITFQYNKIEFDYTLYFPRDFIVNWCVVVRHNIKYKYTIYCVKIPKLIIIIDNVVKS